MSRKDHHSWDAITGKLGVWSDLTSDDLYGQPICQLCRRSARDNRLRLNEDGLATLHETVLRDRPYSCMEPFALKYQSTLYRDLEADVKETGSICGHLERLAQDMNAYFWLY